MYHYFFIHSAIDKYLSYYYILGIVYSAAMNICVLI